MASTSENITNSVKLRQEGNEFYKNAFVEGLSPALAKSRLQQSMVLYMKALAFAFANGNHDDAASAAKNYAKAAHHITILLKDKYQEDLRELVYYHKETYKYFNRALEHGQNCKSEEWRADILSTYRNCYDDLVEVCSEIPCKERVTILESAATGMEEMHYYGDCCLEIANIWSIEALTALLNKDYKRSIYALKEMYHPIESIKKFPFRLDLQKEARMLEVDVVIQTAQTESLQAIDAASTMLKNHLEDYDEIDMDCIYTVIDTYHHAIVLTRDIEIEIEAIALSRLGHLYDSVLKEKSRAAQCFKKSIELAHAMFPRVLNTEQWYKIATDTLRRYQEETVASQQKKANEEKQKYIKELATELKILNDKKDLKDGDYLFYVVKKFPPKKEFSLPQKDKLSEMTAKELKKIFQKAIVVYHPDKQDVEKHGMKWKVLCEEITKSFTRIYEGYKIFDTS